MKDDVQELLIVVDQNDAILEYKTRYDCHHTSSLIHRTIRVLLYNDSDEMLMQKRSKKKDVNPEKITHSVSGHITKGQTYEEAALREMIAVYFGKHNGPFSPDFDEINSLRFLSHSAITEHVDQFTPIAKEIVERVEII